ncbi:MAG: SBBP repeat-containing protein [Deltaproteobacteria bacterium]|nr:SBBP repeat-containing protein [Deltaproteobacteria bacterium]
MGRLRGNGSPAPLKKGGFESDTPSPFAGEGRGERAVASESIKLSFINANENPEIVALDEQAGKVNYLMGNDQSKWKTNIPTFSSVLYKDVYDGIDIRFYGTNQQLEYDVIIKPGADPNVVRFAYDGIEGLKVTDNGDLEIALKQGKILQKKPYVYQEIDGERKEVEARFELSANSYSFALASYDTTRDLVIDPVLEYSTYLGGAGIDYGYGIAIDSLGNAYVTGYTSSTDFPTLNALDSTANGNYDAFIAKLDSTGSALSYSTYLGGTYGETGYGIAIDSSGNAYVTGQTYSSDFPILSAYDSMFNSSYDAFVAKLDPTGSALVYSTYLGGTDTDYGYGIAIDSSGNAYVTGATYSTDFSTLNALDSTANGNWDVFVAKLNSTGSGLLYSTYLGGSSAEYGRAIALDSSTNAYVTGYTLSTNFPTANAYDSTANGNWDAFVMKIATNTAPELSYSTDTGYSTDGVDPDTGTASNTLTYKVVYTDADNNAPNSPDVHIDGDATGAAMTLDPAASAALRDGVYTNGEQYKYSTLLSAGSHNYYFTASDGIDSARLPSTSTLSGPTVSDLVITTTSPLPSGTAGAAYSQTLTATGGTTAYAWSATGLPAGLSLDASTGVISGTPVTAGTYGFTATVTDAASLSYSKALSLTISGDSAPPTGSISINNGAAYTASTAVTLTLSCTDTGSGCAEMAFTNDPACDPWTWTDWETYGTSKAWNLSGGDGTKTVCAAFKDASGNVSADYTDTIIMDTTPPTGSIYINPTLTALGSDYTNSSAVTLTLTCQDCTEMRLGSSPWSAWEPFAATKSWDMGAGDGYRTVFAQFRDALGNVSVEYTDSIELDTVAPEGSFTLTGVGAVNLDPEYSYYRYANYYVNCADNLSGSGCYQKRFSEDNVTWGAWEYPAPMSGTYYFSSDGFKTVYAQVRDRAGNVSPSYLDTVTVDTVKPTGTLTITPDMLSSNGDKIALGQTVVLTLTCEGTGSPCVKMSITDSPNVTIATEPFATTKTWTFLPGDGLKMLCVQYWDASNNVSDEDPMYVHDICDTIILDTVGPTAIFAINNNKRATNIAIVGLGIVCVDAGSGCVEMEFKNADDANANWSGWEPYLTPYLWELSAGEGEKDVWGDFKDAAGFRAPPLFASDTIIYDITPPTAGNVALSDRTTGNVQFTDEQTVNVTPVCDDGIIVENGGTQSAVAYVQFSENLLAWTALQAYVPGMVAQFTLSAGDGAKTVWAKCWDWAGNSDINVSNIITLDTVKPNLIDINIENGDLIAPKRAV